MSESLTAADLAAIRARADDRAFIAHAREDVPRLLAEVDRLTAERDEAWREAAELRATLENERGEGEPPCEGWEFFPGGPSWHCAPGTWVRPVPEMGWCWYTYAEDESTIAARGEAKTARAAMRAASGGDRE